MRLSRVEDNEELASLQAAGFSVEHCANAVHPQTALSSILYSALIPNITLPDEDGFAVRTLRSKDPLPVIILTARSGVSDRMLRLQTLMYAGTNNTTHAVRGFGYILAEGQI